MNRQTMQCYLMMLFVIAGIAVPLHAAPPEISEAELNALRAQYREEMSKQNELKQLRDERIQAQRQSKRLHRQQQRQPAIRDMMEQVEAQHLAKQAELNVLKLDFSAVDISDIALGMLPSQDKPAGGAEAPAASKGNLAEQATNPVAPLIQFQLQNNFVGESNSGDGYSNSFVVQPVIPWKLGEQAIITRITLPLAVGTPDLGGSIGREYGVGDLVLLNVVPWTIDKGGPWEGQLGAVFTTTLPTASSDFLGAGKYQAGPGLLYINTATKGLQWGIFVYQQWSFASAGGDDDRRDVSKLFFQPILTKHFDKGWYVSMGDILFTLDFEDNNRFSFPVGIRLGRVTKFGDQPVNIFVEPFYDFSGNNNGNEWGVKLSVTFLFPSS